MPKAYVSSTFEDLVEHRKVISLALRRAGFEDVAMEYYVAEDKRAVERCLADVAACDLYVGIFAWRYGWKPPKSKVSITELEYREAVRLKKPRLLFLSDPKAPWPPLFVDPNRKQVEALRKRISEDHVAGFFSSPDSLTGQIAPALSQHAQTKLAVPLGIDAAEYYRYLRKRYGFVDLDALMDPKRDELLPLGLETVFVEQSVKEDPPPLELTKDAWEILERRKEIHDDDLPRGLTSEEIAQLRRAYTTKASQPALQALADPSARLIVILGDPGSGKSTLLRYLAVTATTAEHPLPGLLGERLPILVDLKTYAALRGRNECRNFFEYFDCLHREENCPVSGAALRDYLEAKRLALVLFDGIDEIFDPREQERITRQITAFADAYADARIVVTSRIIGYRRALLQQAGFRHLTLQDLERDQVLSFARQWYGLTTTADITTRIERIVTAYDASASIRQLAGNPMLLTIMAIIGKHQELPRERWSLYEHAASVLVTHWDVKKHLAADDLMEDEDKKDLLRQLAYTMQSGEGGLAGNYIHAEELQAVFENYLETRYGFDAERRIRTGRAMIAQFRERNFILALYGANLYGFVHRAFLEFFCASAIVRRFEKTRELTVSDLKGIFDTHADEKVWHEVLRLICGALDEPVAAELIEELLSNHVFERVVLALECFSELRRNERASTTATKLFAAIVDCIVSNRGGGGVREPLHTALHLTGARWPNPESVLTYIEDCPGIESWPWNVASLLVEVGANSTSFRNELLRRIKEYKPGSPVMLAALLQAWTDIDEVRSKVATIATELTAAPRWRAFAARALAVVCGAYPAEIAILYSLVTDPDIGAYVRMQIMNHFANDPRTFPILLEEVTGEESSFAFKRLEDLIGRPEVRHALEKLAPNHKQASEILARHPPSNQPRARRKPRQTSKP